MKNIFYFRKEIDYLQKTRELFINKYPKLAPFLACNSNDPDVERIIESLAILTAKINEELDGNIPSLAESLINILMPNYTNSLPSFCIQNFNLKPDSKDNNVFIPRHTSVVSSPVQSVRCEFRTIYDVMLHPLKIYNVDVGSEGKYTTFVIDIETTQDHLTIADINIKYLNLYLGNEIYTANTLLLWLLQYVKDIIILSYDTHTNFKIPTHCLQPMGFNRNESVSDNDDLGFSAFILLQELFFMSEKFHFIHLEGLEALKDVKSKKMGIKFIFNKELPKNCLPRANQFSLFATPAINLFSTQAEPILLDHSRNTHRIFVDRMHEQAYCVIQILKVKAHSNDTGRRVFKNYYSFERFEFLNKSNDFYALANKVDAHGQHYKEISFYTKHHRKETISMDVLCSNNDIPAQLKLHDINEILDYKSVATENITLPTPIKHIDMDSDMMWNLVVILSFNYQNITKKESLLSLLHIFGFTFDSQDKHFLTNLSDAIINIQSQPTYKVHGCITRRGILVTISMDETKFYCLGEVYKIGLIFSHLFASFAAINSFCELNIICVLSNTTFTYPVQFGNKEPL
ncbi:type VI secretion system baseplate subunit TssF [Helicobacter bilis]|uniref:type VI secretion system baseplate subunit TssF n=1 Tax=Helicobacter bilis TaxID=37372 RepID=UPI002A8093A1|nr:type VI secretion system baseplate subunit TssF [Helicobacter bilis]MDY4399635.1 type VI secretion system baseplate subunit TssF [Helicobacter bilis]